MSWRSSKPPAPPVMTTPLSANFDRGRDTDPDGYDIRRRKPSFHEDERPDFASRFDNNRSGNLQGSQENWSRRQHEPPMGRQVHVIASSHHSNSDVDNRTRMNQQIPQQRPPNETWERKVPLPPLPEKNKEQDSHDHSR